MLFMYELDAKHLKLTLAMWLRQLQSEKQTKT